MSLTVSTTDGVTVLTLTSDPQGILPPICQILKALCYSPVWCSVSQRLKRDLGTSQSMLGFMQIMIGLLTIGLATILLHCHALYWMNFCSAMNPYLLSGLFIFFGAMCILSEKHPSPCLVVLSMILNLAGAAFAITAIVISIINITFLRPPSSCDADNYLPLTAEENQKCLEGLTLAHILMKSISALLIILSLLELCAVVASILLRIAAFEGSERTESKSPDDLEHYKHLLEEVTSNPTVK